MQRENAHGSGIRPEEASITRLYRYRSLGREGDDLYLKPILTESKLYFASPARLNDPFDCLVPSFDGVPRSKLRKFFEQRLREKTRLSRGERRRQARYLAQGEVLDRIYDQARDDFSKLGILCMSARRDDLLMWSHYANGHRGICLEFAASDDTPFFGVALPVKYSAQRPVFDPDATDWERVEAALLTKSSGWLYEQEWRIIDHDQGHGVRCFPEELLTGVILGCAISDADRTKVLDWVSTRRRRPVIYEAHRDARSFALNIMPLSQGTRASKGPSSRTAAC